MRAVVVSIHDVATSTAAAARHWADLMAPLGVPLSILVVPGPWQGTRLGAGDPGEAALVSWLRSRQESGDEISVHGWLHRADVPGGLARRAVGTVVARGAAEMWALDRGAAGRRSADGLAALDRCRLAVTGTTPPGWLSSGAARRGMADAGLQYVTDHAGLADLATGRRWNAAALCHRPAVLGVVPGTAVLGTAVLGPAVPGAAGGRPEPGRFGLALEQLGRRAVLVAPRACALGAPIRIGLHPADLDRPGLREAAVAAVRGCLDAGATALTYAAVLHRLRARDRPGAGS